MPRALAWITLALTLAFALSPLATAPFSGFDAGQLPVPQEDPPVQPAGYAFAIWGLIYLWLAVSAGFGVARRADDPDWTAVRWPLAASLALGTPWLWVANQSAVWATVLIFPMAATAIVALLRTPARDRWWLRAPVAVYAGWLTAASFVALGSTAAGFGVLTGQTGWAYIGITGALLVAALTQRRAAGAPEYGLTVVWALVAIVAANGGGALGVSLLAGLGVAVMTVLAIGAATRARAA